MSVYGESIVPFETYPFEQQFSSLLTEVPKQYELRKKEKTPSTYENSVKAQKSGAPGKTKKDKDKENKPVVTTPVKNEPPAPSPQTSPIESLNSSKGPGKKPIISPGKPKVDMVGGRRGNKGPKRTKKNEEETEKKPTKGPRIWDEDKVDKSSLRLNDTEIPDTNKSLLPDNIDDTDYGINEEIHIDQFDSSSSEEVPSDVEDDIEPEEKIVQAPKKSGGLLQFFTNMVNKELTQADLEPIMEQFSNHLVAKNVAREIAEKLCASVTQNLIGKQMSSFSRVSTSVRAAMEDALTRILTPKKQIDVLRDARAAKNLRRPYVIVFVGVNGVGKSTSLAKVCSWLLQNELKVMIAACDTFRSGAVEQLEVHARNLGVEVFHRGYGKDAAAVAKEAITKAKNSGKDVVLVDTAGRMQDNEPLMKALAKLVGVNQPDLVLFVGEALVGNEAVDQLTKFNRALEEFALTKDARGIDGIFLTKFDTVDEKVGAAISMVYTTGQPIVFVGIGQKYSDLKVLNPSKIVSILLKGK
jgi:signal recognition particle receptor subunit alpha